VFLRRREPDPLEEVVRKALVDVMTNPAMPAEEFNQTDREIDQASRGRASR
jgi:hypothetical protein